MRYQAQSYGTALFEKKFKYIFCEFCCFISLCNVVIYEIYSNIDLLQSIFSLITKLCLNIKLIIYYWSQIFSFSVIESRGCTLISQTKCKSKIKKQKIKRNMQTLIKLLKSRKKNISKRNNHNNEFVILFVCNVLHLNAYLTHDICRIFNVL